MPTLPYSFVAGQQAKAEEINANFDALAEAVGLDSTDDSMTPPGDLILGPRKNMQIQPKHDDGNSARRYLHIGWNAELYKTGSVWKYRRFLTNNPATSFRVGPTGFEVWTTSTTSGDLNAQMNNVMALRITQDDDYLYLRPKMQRYDGQARNIEDFRNTYVFLDDTEAIYDDRSLTAATEVRKATDYGIPQRATGIAISAEVQAGSSDAKISFLQERSPRQRSRGFSLHAAANEWASGWGVVPLGRGGYEDKFVIQRSAHFVTANVYIVGYFW